MTTQPTLGDLVKHARREAGLTQEALAARTGLSARAISDLERNVIQAPRATTVQLLVSALALSAREREHFEKVARANQAPGRPAEGERTPALEPVGRVPAEFIGLDPASRPPLVGREAEIAMLEQHLSGTGPALLVVEGEPGIGKTRLLDESTVIAARLGLNVLQGTVAPTGKQGSRDPVLDAVRRVVETRSPLLLRRDLQGCGWIARVLPELALGPLEPPPTIALPADQEAALIARAIVRFLSNTAGPGGTLLTLDNLHHADAAALERLTKLVQAASEVPLRIVCAFRDSQCTREGALDSLLGWLAHEQHVRHLRLSALSSPDSADVLRRFASEHRLNAAMVSRVVRETGGVPFYVVAWARDLQRLDTAHAADHLPWAIRQSVRARKRAHPSIGPVLEAIAVAGGRASIPLLVAVCPWAEKEVLTALEAAACEYLVEEDGRAYGFTYAVVRAAVEADLTHTRRVLLRQRLTAALPSAPPERHGSQAPLDERAYHLSVLRRHRGRR